MMVETCRKLDIAWLGTVDYTAALALQDAMAAARYRDLIGDTILLLEHPHVFTLGRGADEHYLLRSIPGVPVHRVSRGGEVTYHGPGQLVGYPILKLEGRERDVHLYLRRLEQTVIEALAKFEVGAGRRAGMTGVWVGQRKIASIGVGIRRWVTLHGFALNVCPNMSYFDAIVPCGIEGCRMTSVERECDRGVGVAAIGAAIRSSFAQVSGYGEIIEADPAGLWTLVDHNSRACEARQ